MPYDWAPLRQIMYKPSQVWLATENSGDRWLTDQYVLLLVTGYDMFADLTDGPYKLTPSDGPRARDSVPEPDLEEYFGVIADSQWQPATPSEWSVAEHPGKAMLWECGGQPRLLGEPTWTAINLHHPGAVVESTAGGRNFFRFSEGGSPFCFAAGIRIPDGQEIIAKAIAGLL